MRETIVRKRLEEALRKFSRVIEQTASTVVITDTRGVIEYVNPRFTATTGYTAAEAIGRRPSLLKSGHTSEEEYRDLWRTISAGRDWHGEFHNRRKDGSLYWESAIISPIRDEQGRITHYAAIKDDITQRKRTEAELAAMHAEREQLLKVQVAGQTVAAIAHELNQPLTAIANYAELALDLLQAGNPSPETLREAMEGSARQARRASDVMRELLGFLRQGEVHTEPLEIDALVQRVLSRAEADCCGEFHGRLELETPPGATVQANRLQVEKVLDNLIQNGIEAMRGVGAALPVITVAVRALTEKGCAQVTVRDSGPGVDAEILPHLFDPFFSTKRHGLGMGLAISRAIIEAHGGRLWVEAQPSAGAAFHFTLPCAPLDPSGDSATPAR